MQRRCAADRVTCIRLGQALRRIADPLRNIAIVGNGPITAYQRRQIEEADVVVRFNKLDNW